MIGVAKLLPVAIMVGGVYKGVEKAKPLLEYTRTVSAQKEVNEIVQMLRLDSIDRALPTPDQFGEYLRQNFHTQKGVVRDVAQDFWGTPYRLAFAQAGSFSVRSAGPDKKFESSDDVVASGHLQN